MTAAVPASSRPSWSVIATAIISQWNAVHSYRGTRISNVINTVTRQRIEWMEQVRDDVATYSGLIYTWCVSRLEGKQRSLLSSETSTAYAI
jgi:hypothetical protein